MSTDPLRTVDITEGESVNVEFSYNVKWKETHIPYERRMILAVLVPSPAPGDPLVSIIGSSSVLLLADSSPRS